MNNVRVRFAPSPTGMLHIGGLRTALFNWLWARKNGGKFILRVEDTDRERFVEGAVENIVEALKWYGLTIDEGPVYQSERKDLYTQYVDQLLGQEHAYKCFCTKERLDEVRKIQETNKQATKYDGLCRSLGKEEVEKKIASGESYVVRLKVPQEGSTQFEDQIYGSVTVENIHVDDQVLLKSDGFPTYHLANVVDDHEMKITHVIRAEEWLPSTPKHVLLYDALGWKNEMPTFAHLPMVLGSDKAKLSKRHGAKPALEYKDAGYLPEAVLNFIALLGWNPKTEKEIFSLDELVKEFDLVKVNKSSAVFNTEKLDWMNAQYIKAMDTKMLTDLRKPYLKEQGYASDDEALYIGTVKLEQDRLSTINDQSEVAGYIFNDPESYNPQTLIPKKESKESVLETMQKLYTFLSSQLDEVRFENAEKLKEDIVGWINENELTNKVVLWPLRVALSGKEKSADVFDISRTIGKKRILTRVEKAIESLQKM